jgi:hypothetical protein
MLTKTARPITVQLITDQPAVDPPAARLAGVLPAPPRPATRPANPTRSRKPTFTCATCEVEIAGRPTIHVGVAFCCAGCVASGPCTCSYDDVYDGQREPAGGWQVHECRDVTALDEEPRRAGARR